MELDAAAQRQGLEPLDDPDFVAALEAGALPAAFLPRLELAATLVRLIRGAPKAREWEHAR